MACVTIPVDSSFKERLALFPWINWSEIAREEAMKKMIFEKKESLNLWKFNENKSEIKHLRFFNNQSFNLRGEIK